MGAGPRFFRVRPPSSPVRRCARQVVRFEEYNPSRRSRAPIVPGSLQASASRKIYQLVLGGEAPPGGLGQHLDLDGTSRSENRHFMYDALILRFPPLPSTLNSEGGSVSFILAVRVRMTLHEKPSVPSGSLVRVRTHFPL